MSKKIDEIKESDNKEVVKVKGEEKDKPTLKNTTKDDEGFKITIDIDKKTLEKAERLAEAYKEDVKDVLKRTLKIYL